MEITSGFIVVGLLMTIAGAIMIFVSLNASPQDKYENSDSIRYIGSIPIAVNGRRVWILTALIISVVLITFLIIKTVYPSILGGI